MRSRRSTRSRPPWTGWSSAPSAVARNARRKSRSRACTRCPIPVTASSVQGSCNKAREGPMAERTYRKLFWGLAAAGALLDQAAKYGVFRWLYNGEEESARSVVSNVFDLRVQYSQATDAGTGLLASLRTWSAERLPGVNTGAVGGLSLGLSP